MPVLGCLFPMGSGRYLQSVLGGSGGQRKGLQEAEAGAVGLIVRFIFVAGNVVEVTKTVGGGNVVMHVRCNRPSCLGVPDDRTLLLHCRPDPWKP